MKQGKSVITFAMAAIAVALVIYFGFYVAKVFSEPYTTALAYTYTSNDSAEAVGILVRQETVLPAQTGIVDVTRSEGEKVGVGQTVALIYRDSQAQADQAELDRLTRSSCWNTPLTAGAWTPPPSWTRISCRPSPPSTPPPGLGTITSWRTRCAP